MATYSYEEIQSNSVLEKLLEFVVQPGVPAKGIQ